VWIRTDIPKREIFVMVCIYIVANVISGVGVAVVMRWMR
jgi:hypothetical protein